MNQSGKIMNFFSRLKENWFLLWTNEIIKDEKGKDFYSCIVILMWCDALAGKLNS